MHIYIFLSNVRLLICQIINLLVRFGFSVKGLPTTKAGNLSKIIINTYILSGRPPVSLVVYYKQYFFLFSNQFIIFSFVTSEFCVQSNRLRSGVLEASIEVNTLPDKNRCLE